MGGSYGCRRVCYARSNEKGFHKLKFVKSYSFAPGFMVWTSVSYYGKTSLISIDKGVDANADYYINKALKPFLRKDVPRMFPRREKKCSIVTRPPVTLAKRPPTVFNKCKVKFITHAEWMSKGTDVAPMDFGIWGILKRRLQKCAIYTMTGL